MTRGEVLGEPKRPVPDLSDRVRGGVAAAEPAVA